MYNNIEEVLNLTFFANHLMKINTCLYQTLKDMYNLLKNILI
jgi:hypothetical protein